MLAIVGLGFQQNEGFDPNAKIKSVFIYHFTRYFEWPESMKTGRFVIEVVGNSNSLQQELTKMAASKQVGNQKIEIKCVTSLDAGKQPNIVFLLPDASDLLKEAVAKYKGKGSLIITEKRGLARAGATINFVAVDNKQKFEYCKTNAIKAGLKASAELNNLGIVIN